MTDATWLILLTVVEIVALVAVLAAYVVIVTRQLHRVAEMLGRIAFGVRAVERQVGVVDPALTRVNGTLRALNDGLLPQLTDRAKDR